MAPFASFISANITSCSVNLSYRSGCPRSSPSHKRPWQLNILVIWGEGTQWTSINLQLNPQGIYSLTEETNMVIVSILIVPLQEKTSVSMENSALKFAYKVEKLTKSLPLLSIRYVVFFSNLLISWAVGQNISCL